MKSVFRTLIPQPLIKYYRQLKLYFEKKRNFKKTTEEVFTDIYEKNKWGGSIGEFSSGSGSTDEAAVSAYISTLAQQASVLDFPRKTFVDLGCGDFRVGKQLLPYCDRYIGVDIVKSLVDYNQSHFGSPKTHFIHSNILEDELPNGEICFVRQVLQHLSNQQIKTILDKLSKYQHVYISEHYPSNNVNISPNKDKAHGGDIRLYENSGVYLSDPPFDLPKHSLRLILEVPGGGLGEGYDQGVIRTYHYRPRND